MKVLVTGSRGLVGKELVLLLKEFSLTEFDVVFGDNVLSESQLNKKMRGVDAVIHLAGIVDDENKSIWEVNVEGTRNVVNSAVKNKVKRIVFLSSTGVYGETKNKVSEFTSPNPISVYEKSKLVGEKIVLEKRKEIEVIIIRSAMIFGASEYWRRMIGLLKKKYPLPLSGKNSFQVIYSGELARAIKLILIKGVSGETYLVSGKEKLSLNKFCNLIQKELGLKQKIVHIPSIIGVVFGKIFGVKLISFNNIRHLGKERNYSLKKITKLGWKQRTSLGEAIKIVVKELEKK